MSPGSPGRVLVVGAGIAGLTCAGALAAAGHDVRVVDKGRRPGGRMASRERDGLAFDHGAQYFTVRDSRFSAVVEGWRRAGLARRWRGRIGALSRGAVRLSRGETERWVGVPSMRAIGEAMASGLAVESGRRVVAVEHDGGWTAACDDGSRLDATTLVLALPAPQAAALLPPTESIRAAVAAVEMAPCWALLAAFEERLSIELDGAFVEDSPLSWAARDSSKPGRREGERWVLHAGPEWSREHLESAPDRVVELLLEAFAEAAGRALPEPGSAVVHRWLYARTSRPLGRDCLYDAGARLGVCGDWSPGERVEGAFSSGLALAAEIQRGAALAAGD